MSRVPEGEPPEGDAGEAGSPEEAAGEVFEEAAAEAPEEAAAGEAPETGPAQGGGTPGGEPTEEELRAAIEEQLRRITVQDVLLQTAATLVNLAGRRLGLTGSDEERDLGQARLAIDALRALAPLVPGQEAGAIKEALSQLQIAFVREAQGAPAPATAPAPDETPDAPTKPAKPERESRPKGDPASERRRAEEAERARARSKIWTPPGS